MTDKTLDVKGLNCPLPILRAKKTLKDMPPGAVLEVLATDPGSLEDFPAFCKSTSDELVEAGADGGVYRFLIRRAR